MLKRSLLLSFIVPVSIQTFACQDDNLQMPPDGKLADNELSLLVDDAIRSKLAEFRSKRPPPGMYGVDQEPTDVFARQCLLARRYGDSSPLWISPFDVEELIA